MTSCSYINKYNWNERPRYPLTASFLGAADFDSDYDEPIDVELNETLQFCLKTNNKILLVEDNPIILKIHQHMLQNSGYEVDVATTGKEALTLMKNQYGLIFMDIGLPDMNGISVSYQIRQLASGNAVPIIALTAFSVETVSAACQTAGMNEVVTKPVPPNKLHSILKHYLTN